VARKEAEHKAREARAAAEPAERERKNSPEYKDQAVWQQIARKGRKGIRRLRHKHKNRNSLERPKRCDGTGLNWDSLPMDRFPLTSGVVQGGIPCGTCGESCFRQHPGMCASFQGVRQQFGSSKSTSHVRYLA
jgi:hypothetical protein